MVHINKLRQLTFGIVSCIFTPNNNVLYELAKKKSLLTLFVTLMLTALGKTSTSSSLGISISSKSVAILSIFFGSDFDLFIVSEFTVATGSNGPFANKYR